jgi:hypothetical protein
MYVSMYVSMHVCMYIRVWVCITMYVFKYIYMYVCFFLYGCKTWSLTLREEHRLRVFENRVLRIFGPKSDEVKREWRKLHNEELNDLYSSLNVV